MTRWSLLAVFVVGCGSSVTEGPPGSAADTGGGGADTGATDTGTTVPTKSFKTHVILGDSISDGGGEGPFFYNLLDKNDDARWPAGAGHDFATRYPGIQIQKKSKGGSTAANLGGQIDALPAALPGPVFVSVTIGGNDVQAAMFKLMTGGDDTKERTDFAEFMENALTKLHAPDRFGPGVDVTVVLTNIYDPSDGTGKFAFASGTKCSGALGFWPAGKETTPLLDPWEKIMTDAAAKHPGTFVIDLRGKFKGHGVPAAETWFVKDCIHPNAAGHAAIRDLFWDQVQSL